MRKLVKNLQLLELHFFESVCVGWKVGSKNIYLIALLLSISVIAPLTTKGAIAP